MKKGKIINQIEMYCNKGFQGDLIRSYDVPHFRRDIYHLDKYGQIVKSIE
ncbi:hypothetical protein M2373_003831 [Chryseobacterium sp. JUb7]|nr:hypothetical protein [Chryseobacterium sp. JUb7]